MKKRKLAAWIVLTIIAVVAAFCLALTNEVTEDVIEQQAVADAEAARKTLVPDADAFEALEAEGVDSLYRGTKDGEAVGYVAQVTVTGFGGPVEITVGTQADAPELTGIKVGGSSFSETAGLGAKSKEPKFMNQFAGKTAPVMLNDGEENDTDAQEIDAITAATITSKAVVRGVNQAVEAIAPYAGFELDSGNGGAVALGDGRFAATAAGFGGDVYVEITLDDTNTITDIVVGDDKFAETPGLGGKAQDDEFKSQFIGKTGQLVLGQDIDAIAGATITSNAVVNAVNTAMAAATGEEVVAAPAVEPAAAPAAPAEARTIDSSLDVRSATAKGFGGDVHVEIGLDADGKIADIVIGDDKFAETAGLGAKAQEPEFYEQFIGQTGPFTLGENVDAIASATITSTAVVDAVNEALAGTAEQAQAPVEETAQPAAEVVKTVSATKKGFGGDVYVELGLDAEGKIAEITIGDDKFAETPGLGARAQEDEFKNQFIGQTGPFTLGENVDAIAGATITSTAVVDAVNEALASAAPAEEAAPVEAAEPAADASELTKVSATKKGFGGNVYVELGLDEEGKIAEITIGDDKFAETPGLGARAQEDEFKNQFIGKSGKLELGTDIDAIAGATITSQAVVDAVNEALASKN